MCMHTYTYTERIHKMNILQGARRRENVRQRWLLIVGSSIIVMLCFAYFIYFVAHFKAKLDSLFSSRSLHNIWFDRHRMHT